jgi:Phage integrase, N-terminal SAM-like domain
VTRLRTMMLEELERRNYLESTKRTYVQTIEDLARYLTRPPDQLEPTHIRQYQAYRFRERKLSPNTVNQRTGAVFCRYGVADFSLPIHRYIIPHIRTFQDTGRNFPRCTVDNLCSGNNLAFNHMAHACHSELLSCLFQRQCLRRSRGWGWKVVRTTQCVNASLTPCVSSAGAQAHSIHCCRNLFIGIALCHASDDFDSFGAVSSVVLASGFF